MEAQLIVAALVKAGVPEGSIHVQQDSVLTDPVDGGFRIHLTLQPIVVSAISEACLDVSRADEICRSLISIQSTTFSKWNLGCEGRVSCQFCINCLNPSAQDIEIAIARIGQEVRANLPRILEAYKLP